MESPSDLEESTATEGDQFAESEDIDEPKLSYERILNDLSTVIETDSITSSCLHSKLFAIGTFYGRIHVFDHQGNKVDRQELCVHLKSVNCISIDDKGEYLVSCSNDRLVVYGLCNSEHNFVLMPDKPMNVVAIDPQFYKPGGGRRFVAGDDRVVLYERGFLARYKSTILQSKEQKVRTLSWHGQFIAWATDIAVQIFDVEQRAIITRIKRDSELELEHSCQLCWKDSRTLLIGWGNTVKVCLVKDRSHEVLNETQLKELPRKYVEIVSMFETDFIIHGLAPFSDNLLTLSIHNLNCDNSTRSINSSSNSDKELAIRPQVHILETFSNSYNELSKDILTPNRQPSRNFNAFLCVLLSLHKEGIYFIVCHKDVISAKPRDYDDHIDWLIQHSMLEECCSFARENSSELVRHSVKEIEGLYMRELLSKGTPDGFSEAGKLCSSICGSDSKVWDQTIKSFHDLNQLKFLLPHLPKRVDGFHLKKESYDFILNEFMKNDTVSLFKAIKEIPFKLYSLQNITEQVIRSLANDPKNLVLNETLAELYTNMGKFEEAVSIYLDYNDKAKIFSLIRSNNLVAILRDKVDRLMKIDADETSQLLVENVDSIPMRDVVERMQRQKSERYLVSYLHRLLLKDPDSCIEYHDLMVKLYAQHQRESLLNFLKLSTNYRLEEALRICKEANMIKEVVFLHGRMGDLRVALKYITESQGDINEAIEFCKENQDPDLWQDLISYSMDKPEFIGALLKNIGTHINDPIELIDRIPVGCEIEGLMPALVKILQDYQLQISLEQSCHDLMAKDCFSLLEKQIRCQTQGIAIKEDQVCDHCNQPLLYDSNGDNLSNNRSVGPGASLGSTAGSSTGPQTGPATNLNDLVVFGCHHVFHEECCADSPCSESELSTKILTCRVCMLEKDYDNAH